MVNLKELRGFTLAEVLITLVIIGVIAAMTIPTLINKTNNQEYASKLKKVYSTLAQATNRIIAEEGNPRADIGGWANNVDNIFSLYKKHLVKAKECGSDTTCFDHEVKTFDDKTYKLDPNSTNWRKLILADGTELSVDNNMMGGRCNWNIDGLHVCVRMIVDINGHKKPNKLGRDIFQLYIDENQGLQPAGCGFLDRDDCTTAGDAQEKGVYCACRVLHDGAMNY